MLCRGDSVSAPKSSRRTIAADDRRRYRRIQAPLFCRPLGLKLTSPEPTLADISLGGLRIYADDPFEPGQRLKVALFFPDGDSIELSMEVVWIEDLPPGEHAKYDVGMRILEEPATSLARLAQLLEKEPPTE